MEEVFGPEGLIAKAHPEYEHRPGQIDMARAVMRLWPGVQLAFGPTIAGGFYYDFELPHKLSEEDFQVYEPQMATISRIDET